MLPRCQPGCRPWLRGMDDTEMKCEFDNCIGEVIGLYTWGKAPASNVNVPLCKVHSDELWNMLSERVKMTDFVFIIDGDFRNHKGMKR